jgi:SAM-dependent methyltransferase
MTTVSTPEPERLKLAVRRQWNEAAQGWNDSTPLIRAWLRDATEAMLAMACIREGARVLDIAAGAGDQSLDIAGRVGPEGSVLATDISADILAFASANAMRAGHANVETLVADGEELGLDPDSFDAAVSRLGLMFFPDPLQGLREIHRALKPSGMLCTMVFSAPQANPCVSAVMQTALKHAGQEPSDPFRPGSLMSLGRPGLIDELFRKAGFVDVATTTVSAPFRLPSAKDYLSFIRSSASPVLQILSRLDDAAREAAWAEMEGKLRVFNTADGHWAGPNELLLTAGQK